MSWRPHPRLADVDPSNPQMWATCDYCGFVTNQVKMSWSYQWAGNQLINLRFLACELCVDKPQEQLRALILPPDPAPKFNTRPEPYVMDEVDWRVIQETEQIRETQDGELRVTMPSQTEAATEDTE